MIDDIEITEEMLHAGCDAISGTVWFDAGHIDWNPKHGVRMIFEAMVEKSPDIQRLVKIEWNADAFANEW